jgi:SAM-dependent methyltransferase
VRVINAPFETWAQAFSGPPFGLVFAATAWHWIDPKVKYQRAAALLRPGGHLAFWEAYHVHPADVDPFFRAIQPVYDEIGAGLPDGWTPLTLENLPSHEAEVAATGLFDKPAVQRFQWEIRYTAESYVRLIDTFSSNLVMVPWQRERLNGAVRRLLADRPDGLVRRHWGAALHVARRR